MIPVQKRNIALLAIAQSLLLTNGVMLVAINGLLGLQLAPDRRLATLPITTYVIGGALASLAAAFFMKHVYPLPRFPQRARDRLKTLYQRLLGNRENPLFNLIH